MSPGQHGRQVARLGQEMLFRQAPHFRRKNLRVHCGDHRLQRRLMRAPAQKRQLAGRWLRIALPPFQQVGPVAQIADQRRIVGERLQLFQPDRIAHPQFDGGVLLVQEFVRQHGRPEPRMDHAQNMKESAIGSPEVHRQHGRAANAGQARDHFAPRRVRNLPLPQVQMRHFPGREHHQHPSLAQALNAIPDALLIGLYRFLPAERVHEYAQIPHFGERGHHEIAHDFHVRADGG